MSRARCGLCGVEQGGTVVVIPEYGTCSECADLINATPSKLLTTSKGKTFAVCRTHELSCVSCGTIIHAGSLYCTWGTDDKRGPCCIDTNKCASLSYAQDAVRRWLREQI